MTITLPDDAKWRIEALAKRHGCSSAVELVLHLIEQAEVDAALEDLPGPPELTPRNREELEAMLLEGLNSGPGVEATPEFWEERRRRIEQRRPKCGDAPNADPTAIIDSRDTNPERQAP